MSAYKLNEVRAAHLSALMELSMHLSAAAHFHPEQIRTRIRSARPWLVSADSLPATKLLLRGLVRHGMAASKKDGSGELLYCIRPKGLEALQAYREERVR